MDNKKTEDQIRFEKEVDKALNENSNDRNTSNAIKVCDTPKILLDYGLELKPMLYNKGHCKNAIKEKDFKKHCHGLTKQQIYDMPKNIASPAMILKSNYSYNLYMPILIFDDCDVDKMPLFMIIKTNDHGMYEFENIETNKILSLYGRDRFDEYFNNILEDNGLVYYNKEKVQKLDNLCGTHFSNRCSSFEPNKILQQYTKKVNNVYLKAVNNVHITRCSVKELYKNINGQDNNKIIVNNKKRKDISNEK